MSLEDLDKVHWEEVNDWFGRSEELPGLIRALAGPQQEGREQAYSQISILLDHQQELCEATVYVIPFLLELLEVERVEDKDRILNILIDFSCGAFSDEIGKHWAKRSYEAVERGIPIYDALQGHPDARTRSAAIKLLKRLSNASDRFL